MRPILAALLVAASACAKSPTGLADDELRSAHQRWASANVRDYSYHLNLSCFCALEPGGYDIVVRAGAFVSAKVTLTGAAADTSWIRSYITIDRAFTRMNEYIAQKPSSFSASYDGQLGYPLTMSVDPVRNAVDEEMSFTITGFTRP